MDYTEQPPGQTGKTLASHMLLLQRRTYGVHTDKEILIMNWDQVEGKWKQFRGSVKEHWGKLTDDDLDVIAGKRDTLVGKIQERYGIAREEAQTRADKWLNARDAKDYQDAATDMSYHGKP